MGIQFEQTMELADYQSFIKENLIVKKEFTD